MNKKEKIKAIEAIIERDGLHTPNRKQVNNMRRRYLMTELKSMHMPLERIGDMFNRTHATVIHNIKQHHWSIESGDLYYITVIKDDMEELNGSINVKYRRILKNDILRCKSYNQLKSIKRRVLRGEYEELLNYDA